MSNQVDSSDVGCLAFLLMIFMAIVFVCLSYLHDDLTNIDKKLDRLPETKSEAKP